MSPGTDLALSPRMKRGVRRRWALDSHGIRRLGNKQEGFRYASVDGKPVRDVKTIHRIQQLHIPPAWREVRIARSDRAPLQAIGVDKKGRTQYLYLPSFRQKRNDEKFLRLVEFAESLPRLRRRVRADLGRDGLERERVLASIVRLIDQGFFRVGNAKSAKFEKTYGLTTVTADHVRVNGTQLQFDYIGKWRKPHRRAITDPEVARLVHELRRIGGRELFKYATDDRIVDVKDRHVNDYIQSIIGEEFTAKDFRTWAGTLLCSIALAMQGQSETKTARKKKIKNAIETTAGLLGNTPAVCRSSYICPRLLDDFMDGRPFEALRKKSSRVRPVAKVGHSREERALVRFLRETIADRRKTPRPERSEGPGRRKLSPQIRRAS